MNKKLFTFLIPTVLLLPSPAFANAGTPLMWTTMLHLVFGNALIGLFEGSLLSFLFKTSKWKTVLVLIAANYASAWIGGYLIFDLFAGIPEITIKNIQFWFWGTVFLAFAVTLLIEFPFFWFTLKKKGHAVRRTIKATLMIHSMSYLLLFGWYWAASGTSMIHQLQVVSASDLVAQENYALYFISPDGSQVIQSDLAGVNKQAVQYVKALHRNDRLFARQNSSKGYDLFIRLESDNRGKNTEELIKHNFTNLAPIDPRAENKHTKEIPGTWFNFGSVPSLATSTDWELFTGFWPIEGIRGTHIQTGDTFHYSLETPLTAWTIRNATHINGDRVVFQLGVDQICLLDHQSKKIALIVRGKGPIVAKGGM